MRSIDDSVGTTALETKVRRAWKSRRIRASKSMPTRSIHRLDCTMCQHDFDGRRLFQHRNMDKWILDGSNRPIVDFWHEDLCRSFLADLRERWSGRVFWNADPDPEEASLLDRLAGKAFRYVRVGHDERMLRMCAEGTIGEGAADQECYWTVNKIDGELVLTILGTNSATCHLRLENGIWRGRWLHYERMPIELQEIEPHVIG
jgi:hypothetical protein